MKEYSFGIIPIKEGKVLLIRHGHHGEKGHWAFPKGHAEPGETPLETAVRELFEETGLKIVKLLSETYEEHYFFTRRHEKIAKTVLYFVAEVTGEVVIQEAEISDYVWLSPKEAAEKATFPETKRLCESLSLKNRL